MTILALRREDATLPVNGSPSLPRGLLTLAVQSTRHTKKRFIGPISGVSMRTVRPRVGSPLVGLRLPLTLGLRIIPRHV